MEIVLVIIIGLVLWFCFKYIKRYMHTAIVKDQIRAYVLTYLHLRDVAMPYASRHVLYEEMLK